VAIMITPDHRPFYDPETLRNRAPHPHVAKASFTRAENSADSRGLADVTPCIATPNAGAQPRLEAEAERKL
jgi:hypothetical protein